MLMDHVEQLHCKLEQLHPVVRLWMDWCRLDWCGFQGFMERFFYHMVGGHIKKTVEGKQHSNCPNKV